MSGLYSQHTLDSIVPRKKRQMSLQKEKELTHCSLPVWIFFLIILHHLEFFREPTLVHLESHVYLVQSFGNGCPMFKLMWLYS